MEEVPGWVLPPKLAPIKAAAQSNATGAGPGEPALSAQAKRASRMETV